MKKYAILLIVITGICSCESFLDVNPKSEIIASEFFKTKEGFEDGLYGVYSRMGVRELYGEDMTWSVPDILAQYYKIGEDNGSYSLISTYKHTYANAREVYKSVWNSMYEAIGYVNNIIYNLELQSPAALKYYDLYKGEALGTRAFLHFDLLRLFAPHITSPDAQGIPYVRHYVSMVTPFSSVSKVYQTVTSELREAETLLGRDEELMTFPRNRTNVDGFLSCRELHCNLYAVEALLARVYWMKGDLDSACIYAKKVIGSQKFPFVDKTAVDKFVAGVVSDAETIWGLNSESLVENVKKSFYESGFMDLGNLYPSPAYIKLCELKGGEGTEYRQGWIGTALNDKDRKTRLMKIVDEDKILKKEDLAPDVIPGVNLIRIPEMYLIVAEALLEKDPGEARRYFDDFIGSRGLLGFASRNPARTLTLEDILTERRKEFIAEGQEWFSMKRLNKDIYNPNTFETFKGSDLIYTILIPDEEFEFRYVENE